MLNQKTVGVFLILLLFSTITVSAADPVNGQACWNTTTGEMFQNRTGVTILGSFEYYNSDPIVESPELCYTYVSSGPKCVIRGVPGPDSRGMWPTVMITVYECPIDDYASLLGLIFSGFVCFYLRRSLSNVKASAFKPSL